MTSRNSRVPDTDHDLLIRIDAKVEMLGQTLIQMQTSFEGRMARLESDKAASADLDVLRSFIEKTQEKNRADIDWSKRMIWMALGGMIVVQAAIAILLAVYFRH